MTLVVAATRPTGVIPATAGLQVSLQTRVIAADARRQIILQHRDILDVMPAQAGTHAR